MPIIRSIATANPVHSIDQHSIQAFVEQLFPKHRRYSEVFKNAQIQQRSLVMPVEWYAQPHPFSHKNALYCQHALDLSEQASQQAISQAGLAPQQIDAVIWVSSTGISTPSLEARLMQNLGIPATACRLPLWGLGCAGGAAGLARAADLVRAGRKNVLLVAVELCSLTFIPSDYSKSNFVGTALFADGCAAAVVSASGEGINIQGSHSTLIANSEDVMGWDVVQEGLKVRFSRDIPSVMREIMPESVQSALQSVAWDSVAHHIVHPGGVKVLNAYAEVSGIDPVALQSSFWVLQNYGNMSSASVLYVLKQYWQKQPLGRGLLTALGPGFCAEHVLLEFV